MEDDARVRDEPTVLSAREVMALLGPQPEKAESPDDESVEPSTDAEPERDA